MRPRSLALASIALALAFAGIAAAGGRLPPSPPGNVCMTQWGWCDLPGITAPIGYACVCLAADNAQVPGVTRQLPHAAPYSQYLRPHPTGTTPAAPQTGR